MALNAKPGSPIIPLNAPVLQGQSSFSSATAGFGHNTTSTPTPTPTHTTSTLAAKPHSTLPLPVILPLTVSIPPSAPLTPPTRGRSRRGQRQRASRAKAAAEPTSPSPAAASVVRSVRPPAIPSIAVSPVGAIASPPAKPLSPQEVQHVESMIERCFHLYMNQEEVFMALQLQAHIAPSITRHVWQGMEAKNPEFFRAYEVRLKIKEQIMAFNYLVSQQAQVTEKSKNMTLDSGSFAAPSTSSSFSSAQALSLPFAPFNPLGGAGSFEPLPSPFAAPAPLGFMPLTTSLSSLLTGVQPPSGLLTSSTESALTLSTNSLINSFLKSSSDNIPSASSSPSPPTATSTSSSLSLSFAFGPPPSQLNTTTTSSLSSSLLSSTANGSTGLPLLSSGSFAMPFISVENIDAPTTLFSPYALFSTQPVVSLGSTAEPGSLFGSSSSASDGSTSSAMPIPNQSLLGDRLRNSTASVSPMSTSPTPESFLTSSICSIPLTASTNALLDALSAGGGTSPLRFSPFLTASTAGALEGLFSDLGGGGGSSGDDITLLQHQEQERSVDQQ